MDNVGIAEHDAYELVTLTLERTELEGLARCLANREVWPEKRPNSRTRIFARMRTLYSIITV